MSARMIDLNVAELLVSRLCHDLVGPIGAIGNGLELMGELDSDMEEEARCLVQGSAKQGSSVLQFFRLAYGAAGGIVDQLGQVEDIADSYLKSRKVRLDWQLGVDLDLPKGLGKILLNMTALAADALPRGGSIEVETCAEPRSIIVRAVGEDVGLRSEVKEGLTLVDSVEAMSPRGVHGYFTMQLVTRQGVNLSIAEPRAGKLDFMLVY